MLPVQVYLPSNSMQPVMIYIYNMEIAPFLVSAVINTTPMNVERITREQCHKQRDTFFIAMPVLKRLMCTCMLTIAQVKIRTTP